MSADANSVNIKSPGVAPKPRYHHGQLRAALIAAGLELLETRGLDALSLREMARRAGVSATAVYRHFPDKAAVLTALGDYGLLQLGEQQRLATLAAGGGREGFVASGMTYVRFAVEHPALFRLSMAVPPGSDQLGAPIERVAPAMRQLRDMVRELFPAAADAEKQRAAALHAWALVHGLSQLILDGLVAWEPARIESVLRHLGSEVQ